MLLRDKAQADFGRLEKSFSSQQKGKEHPPLPLPPSPLVPLPLYILTGLESLGATHTSVITVCAQGALPLKLCFICIHLLKSY